MLQVRVASYRCAGDNFFAFLSSAMLVLVLQGSLALQSEVLAPKLEIGSEFVTVVLFVATLTVLFLAFGFFVIELRAAGRQPVLRYRETRLAATLPPLENLDALVRRIIPYPPPNPSYLPDSGPFHIFLSHNWLHGQEAMRVVKTRLRLLLPDVKVFLDVDNHGEGMHIVHIDVSNVVLCYLTEKWFTNPPCVIEIVRAVLRKKPLIALLEPDMSDQHGGVPEARCRKILLSQCTINTPEGEMTYSELLQQTVTQQVASWAREWNQALHVPTGEEIVQELFARPALVWYRLTDFQDVTMRHIAERLLPSHNSFGSQATYIPGTVVHRLEQAHAKLLAHPECTFHLYCSSNSPRDGAAQIANALKQTFLPGLTWTADPSQLALCEHMLVPLTSETWTRGETSREFVCEVCQAMRLGVHRLLVHEVPGARLGDNEERHATSFAQIIADTPTHLNDAQLYNQIAENLAGGEWREVGLAKMALQLAKGSGQREQWVVAVDEPGFAYDEPLTPRAPPASSEPGDAAQTQPSLSKRSLMEVAQMMVSLWRRVSGRKSSRPTALADEDTAQLEINDCVTSTATLPILISERAADLCIPEHVM